MATAGKNSHELLRPEARLSLARLSAHRKGITCGLAFVAGLAGSLTSLKYCTLPYFWIGMLWTFVSVLFAVVITHSTSRMVLANAAAFAAALSLAELYLWSKQDPEIRHVGVYVSDPDEVLGYAPKPNITQPSARAYVGDDLIYDIRYSIDANGLRTTRPNGGVRSSARCILFFGGSFTFGEGVNDDETMPEQVAIRAPEPVRVYNFGFPGYGPHQMLSALEHGLVDRVVGNCSDGLAAIYQAIPDHVKRAAGLAPWDRHGPRYRLASDGHVEFTGHFDDRYWLAQIRAQFGKSLVWSHIFGYAGWYRSGEADLFIGIVKRAREIVEGKGGEFHMILWDEPSDGRKLAEALRRSGVAFHPMSKILPDHDVSSPEKYALNRYDQHPNPLAYARIAAYICDHILWREQSDQDRDAG